MASKDFMHVICIMGTEAEIDLIEFDEEMLYVRQMIPSKRVEDLPLWNMVMGGAAIAFWRAIKEGFYRHSRIAP